MLLLRNVRCVSLFLAPAGSSQTPLRAAALHRGQPPLVPLLLLLLLRGGVSLQSLKLLLLLLAQGSAFSNFSLKVARLLLREREALLVDDAGKEDWAHLQIAEPGEDFVDAPKRADAFVVVVEGFLQLFDDFWGQKHFGLLSTSGLNGGGGSGFRLLLCLLLLRAGEEGVCPRDAAPKGGWGVACRSSNGRICCRR